MSSGNFKTNYTQDAAIFQTVFAKFWLVVLFIIVLILPKIVGEYLLYLVIMACIAAIGAVGLNILSGFTGQISLGHAAFLGIGAYTTAILVTKLNVQIWVALPLSGLLAALASLLVGIPCLRLKSLYLAMATMIFGFIVEYIIVHWNSVTNGIAGMNLSKPRLGNYTFQSDISFYYLTVFLTGLLIIAAKNIIRTKTGRAFMAIRDSDRAAEVMGVNIHIYKLIAFLISSFYAGVAGSLYAYYLNYISGDSFSLLVSIEYIAMLIVGGIGSIVGSVFGAFFIVLLPEAIRLIIDIFRDSYPQLSALFLDLRGGIYGIFIILFLIFQPEGMYGIWCDIKVFFITWPYKR